MTIAAFRSLSDCNIPVLFCDYRHIPTAAVLPITNYFERAARIEQQFTVPTQLKNRFWQKNPRFVTSTIPATHHGVRSLIYFVQLLGFTSNARFYFPHDCGSCRHACKVVICSVVKSPRSTAASINCEYVVNALKDKPAWAKLATPLASS